MVTRLPLSLLGSMESKQIANYIESIIQTEICKDLNYCNQLIKIYLSKQPTNEKLH
jgi:hypothetical protein